MNTENIFSVINFHFYVAQISKLYLKHIATRLYNIHVTRFMVKPEVDNISKRQFPLES